MINKKKYYNLQKYLFSYFKQIGYSFLHNQEILSIPKKITYDTTRDIKKYECPAIHPQYNINHTFTKEELCLILEKYFYCNRILNVAPLTKYLHLNFTYLKHKNPEYYKIKINYVLATPKLQKQEDLLKLNLQFFLCATSKYLTTYLLPAITIKNLFHHATLKKVKKIKYLKINKFLHIIKNKKFQRTLEFFNLLGHKTNIIPEILTIIEWYNYPQNENEYVSAINAFGIQDIWEVADYHNYQETNIVNFYHHIIIPYKTLVLNKFKFFKINNDFDLFYFLFYNYMILNNIYITEDAKLIQIFQNDEYCTIVKNKLIYHSIATDSEVYNSLLLPTFPYLERMLGDTTWLEEHLHNIAKTMSDVLQIYISKKIIISKYISIFTKINNQSYLKFLNSCLFPKKKDLLDIQQISANWTNCMATYILKREVGENLPQSLEKFTDLEDVDLENILIYTNIFVAQKDISDIVS